MITIITILAAFYLECATTFPSINNVDPSSSQNFQQ